MLQESDNNDNLKNVNNVIQYPATDPNEYQIQPLPDPVQKEDIISATTDDGRKISIKISNDVRTQPKPRVIKNPIVDTSATAGDITTPKTKKKEKVFTKSRMKHRCIILLSMICVCSLCFWGCLFCAGGIIAIILRFRQREYYGTVMSCSGGYSTSYSFCFNMTALKNDNDTNLNSDKKFTYFTDNISYDTCQSLLETLGSSNYAHSVFSMTEGVKCFFADWYYDDYTNIEELREEYGVDSSYCNQDCSGSYCGDSTGSIHSFFENVQYDCTSAESY